VDGTRPRTLWAVDSWDAPGPPRSAARDRRRRRKLAARYRRRRLGALTIALVTIGWFVTVIHTGADPASTAGPAAAGATARAGTTPAGSGARAASAPIRPGSHGAAVTGLQTALAQLGVYSGRPDGAYGATTRRAVSRFQAAHGIARDGAAGTATLAAVSHALAGMAAANASTVRVGVATARARGRISLAQARAAGAALTAAVAVAGSAPIGPAAAVTAVLAGVAHQASSLDAPRARALFGMLAVNVERFRHGGLPEPLAATAGRDGVVYRYFPGHGYQFHPLATFGALAAAVAAGRKPDAARIAAAMVARAVPAGAGRVWEYDFPFGGPDTWTSGFAQAAGADALARASQLLSDPALAQAAAAAFAAIPAYLHPIAGGEWIREYSYSPMLILNAQLQTFLLVSDYARRSGSARAAALAAQLETAARRLLPRFDTGCWSRYSLGGAPASAHYMAYHVQLLRQIARVTGERSWATVADRWQGYERSSGGCPSG
jgi:peptidoglycan hydrolase-like protein with peptidoglycan-binding domain